MIIIIITPSTITARSSFITYFNQEAALVNNFTLQDALNPVNEKNKFAQHEIEERKE